MVIGLNKLAAFFPAVPGVLAFLWDHGVVVVIPLGLLQ